MRNAIIIHPGELTLKGKNRNLFETKLILELQKKLELLGAKSIKNLYGRIIVDAVIQDGEKELFRNALCKIFGIANFAFAEKTLPNLDAIRIATETLLREARVKTFKIETIRADKRFPHPSPEINKEIGAHITSRLHLTVDVKNPETICFIEITTIGVFVYLTADSYSGLGGLPTDTGGTMIGFLSGGIDSPVACFKMMQRGAKIIFVHFHSYPQTSRASIAKVEELASLLGEYQMSAKLYLVPFLNIQKQILLACDARARVVLYRRFMMRIGNEIAKKEHAEAIVTGESLGQVASQTIQNLAVIEEAAAVPVLRPLIGLDKNEIIAYARNIGTFDISIRPYDDCCSIFLPKHPLTKTNLAYIEAEEKKLPIDALVTEAIEKNEVQIDL